MNKINKILFPIFLVFNFISSSIYFAQSKTGTTIGQFLKIAPSSRIVAMGNAGASLSGEVSASFYNTASLGSMKGIDVEFTYNKWLADITYNYIAAAINVEEVGTFGIIGTMLNSGEMDVRTVEQPHGTGEKFSVKNFALGLAFARMLTDRVSVGVQVNYITETIWHSSLETFGFNFGVQYVVSDLGLSLGASVSNFGAKASYSGRDLYINYDFDPRKYGDNDQLPSELRTGAFPLPTIFRAGISYNKNLSSDIGFILAIDAIHQNDNDQSLVLGTEILLLKMLSLRVGYRNLFLPNAEGGLVLGGGIKQEINKSNLIRFDYSYSNYGRLIEAHRVTVGVGIY